jgi:hypothetical protein
MGARIFEEGGEWVVVVISPREIADQVLTCAGIAIRINEEKS